MATRSHPNKGRKLPAEPLNRDEVRRLIAACSPRSRVGRRNAGLIATILLFVYLVYAMIRPERF